MMSNTAQNQSKFSEGRGYSLSSIKYLVSSNCKQESESPISEVEPFAGREVAV